MNRPNSQVAPQNSQSEAVEESSSEAKPYTLEDGEQIWKDIQAQTGFDCYEDYLQHYWQDHSHIEMLLSWMIDASYQATSNECYIVDVLAHEDWPPELPIRCRITSGLELLAALRQPPEDVSAQIVIWPIVDQILKELLDTLGLGLRIDPQFFLALLETLGAQRQGRPFRNAVDTRPLRSSHVVIDRVVATYVRHYPIDKPAAPPIILIAGNLDLTKEFGGVTDQNISKPPPFTPPKHLIQYNSNASLIVPDHWLKIYKETFSMLAENNPDNTRCTAAIIAGVLMPLLHMNCLQIKMQCSQLRRTFLKLQAPIDTNDIDHQPVNQSSSNLHHERVRLRRSVENSIDDISHFERFISAEDANYLPDSSAYLSIKQETDQIHNEALRLETEVRDYLQLEVGNLSLEESRRSIELSNHQIQEGKRGS